MGASKSDNGRNRVKIIPRKWSPLSIPQVDLDIPEIPLPGKGKEKGKTAANSTVQAQKTQQSAKILSYEPEWELMWESNGLSERRTSSLFDEGFPLFLLLNQPVRQWLPRRGSVGDINTNLFAL